MYLVETENVLTYIHLIVTGFLSEAYTHLARYSRRSRVLGKDAHATGRVV